MKASEVLNRYARGERDFRRVDLRGQSFKGQDLSGADFSEADIRGTNFTKANLSGAKFTAARAGLQRRSWLLLGSAALILSCMAGFASTIMNVYAAFWFSAPAKLEQNLWSAGIVALILAAGVLLVAISQSKRMTPTAMTLLWLLVIGLAGAFGGAGTLVRLEGRVVAWSVGVTGASAVLAVAGLMEASALALTVSCYAWLDNYTMVKLRSIVWAIVVAEFFAIGRVSTASFVQAKTIGGAAPFGALIIGVLGGYTAGLLLTGDRRFWSIQQFVVAIVPQLGTSFRFANLTQASFEDAALGNTDFFNAVTLRTSWKKARFLDRSKLSGTVLSDWEVRDLLVQKEAASKKYQGKNLQGANLAGANLIGADLTGADLSNATLEGATLAHANLSKVQAIGADFHQTILTGACLSAWNIDSTTQLTGAICQYVYLLDNDRERRPSSGEFAEGEFAKLFQEILNTVDLIFRNGIDWQAFTYSFEKLILDNEGTPLAIQSIENKGDGVVVVRVIAPPEADKGKIHSEFNQTYETALKAIEGRYQAELKAKDDQITLQRQHNADMKQIVELLANRPVTVEVKATAESKTMTQSSDSSRKIEIGNIGGDFNASGQALNLGEISGTVTNTINELQQSATPQASELADLLKQLQSAIEAETELPPDDKAEALEQVGTIAKAGENPQDGTLKKLSSTAVKILKGTVSALPDTAKLADAASKLLPLITKLLGL